MTENKEIALRKQRVFEYLVVLHPTVKYAEEGGLSEIVVPPTTVCGNDIDHARMLANRAIPAEHMN
ncbi:MAG: hypothetical protein KDD44_15375, partial [Bdellovibrionales bacterium]|nr:hypothetical protein [Bdellovibrionales bacterium]